MTVNTAYDILSLPHNATARDLVLAYRRLVKRYHPDYNVDRQAWSTEKMTSINLAYETVRAVLSSRDEAARDGRRSADSEPGTTFEEREAAHRSHFSRSGTKHKDQAVAHQRSRAKQSRTRRAATGWTDIRRPLHRRPESRVAHRTAPRNAPRCTAGLPAVQPPLR